MLLLKPFGAQDPSCVRVRVRVRARWCDAGVLRKEISPSVKFDQLIEYAVCSPYPDSARYS